MPAAVARYPVETISIQLKRNKPTVELVNTDVAFTIATRFNVRLNAGPISKSQHLKGRNRPDSPEYETYWQSRVDIFERVCLPSVLNLSPLPHAWFIAFGDVDLPCVRGLIERLAVTPWIVPYMAPEIGSGSARTLVARLQAHAASIEKSHLCATRLDSDDSLQGTFVGALDKAVTELRCLGLGGEVRSLDFMYGLAESSGQLSVYLRGTNMFQSVYSPREAGLGPYSFVHDRVRNVMPLLEIITNLPMWMYHRHDDAIDTPSALVQDRLPLTDVRIYYPLFGLQPGTGAARAAPSSGPGDADRAPAPSPENEPAPIDRALRNADSWSDDQRAVAVELALSKNLAEVAFWLSADSTEWIDPLEVLREIEVGDVGFLSSARFVELGRLLDKRGFGKEAVRAYDRALRLAPLDVDLRHTRNKLACSLDRSPDRQNENALLDTNI